MQIPERKKKGTIKQTPATLPVHYSKQKVTQRKKNIKNDNSNSQHSTRGTGLVVGAQTHRLQ